jgi:glutamate dehydrogenase (NAD(P)+)
VGGRLPSDSNAETPAQVLTTDCDVLVLAAVSHAVSAATVPELGCRALVAGANLGLSDEIEQSLATKGVLVVPDLVAGAGGSLAVEALYRGNPRTGSDIIEHVSRRVRAIVHDVLPASIERAITPRELILSRLGPTQPP